MHMCIRYLNIWGADCKINVLFDTQKKLPCLTKNSSTLAIMKTYSIS